MPTRSPASINPTLPPPAFRGNCVCGRWLVVLERSYTSPDNMLECECGLSWYFWKGELCNRGASSPEKKLGSILKEGPENTIVCYGCGATSVQIVRQRNERGCVVGILFSCDDCADQIADVFLVTMEFATHYINQMGRWHKKYRKRQKKKGAII